MQQLSSGRILVQRVEDRRPALETDRSGRLSRRLLGQLGLEGSVCQARIHGPTTSLLGGLGRLFCLHAWIRSRRTGMEGVVQWQPIAGPQRSAGRKAGGENRKSGGENLVLGKFRPERNRSASGAVGHGCDFRGASGRESGTKIST